MWFFFFLQKKERMLTQNTKCTNSHLYILSYVVKSRGIKEKKKNHISKSINVTLAKCSRLSDQSPFLGPDTEKMWFNISHSIFKDPHKATPVVSSEVVNLP